MFDGQAILVDLLIQSEERLCDNTIRAHLEQFRIYGDPICVCMMNYETVDHIIWKCSRFEVERRQLILRLAAVTIEEETSIRDLCALQKWATLRLWFLRE
jgi:hypothetical protein